MRALVTGGAGFIGSHIAEALCRRGAQVVVLDDLSSGSLENLSWKRAGDSLEFVQGDIADRGLLGKLLRGCDWVFHEAALVSVPYSVAEPEKSNRINLDGTVGLLVASLAAGIKRFVFASSCAVLGNYDRPVCETDPVNPLSPYALQKYASERYVEMFSSFHGLSGVALRYFNVFGPRQPACSSYSGVIARFCSSDQAVIYGDGSQTRDFVFVEDAVQANLLAAEHSGISGEVFHVGTGRSTSVLDLARTLKVAPRFEAARRGDVHFSRADISKAQRVLGYEPRVTLEAGLKKTLMWARARSS